MLGELHRTFAVGPSNGGDDVQYAGAENLCQIGDVGSVRGPDRPGIAIQREGPVRNLFLTGSIGRRDEDRVVADIRKSSVPRSGRRSSYDEKPSGGGGEARADRHLPTVGDNC